MILITGGAGFVGAHMIDKLIESGYKPEDIVVFDNFSWGKPYSVRSGVKVVNGDITRPEDVDSAVCDGKENVDTIIHLAAIKEVPYSVKHPLTTHKVNVCGTLNVLEAVRKAGTDPKIIYSSAASVYGEPIYSPVDEAHPTNPQNPYSASKVCGENCCTAYHHTYGLSIMILRYSNVYGAGITSPNAMENFVNAAMDGKSLMLYGGGMQKKQFTHVDDICQGTLLAMTSEIEHGIYNIAGGNDSIISIKDLAEEVIRIVGAGSIEYQEKRAGDVHVPDLRISIWNAQYRLGYIPKKSIKQGLEDYIAWKKSYAAI